MVFILAPHSSHTQQPQTLGSSSFSHYTKYTDTWLYSCGHRKDDLPGIAALPWSEPECGSATYFCKNRRVKLREAPAVGEVGGPNRKPFFKGLQQLSIPKLGSCPWTHWTVSLWNTFLGPAIVSTPFSHQPNFPFCFFAFSPFPHPTSTNSSFKESCALEETENSSSWGSSCSPPFTFCPAIARLEF